VDEEEGIRKKSKKGLGAGFAGLGASVLSADVESVYRPASRETRAVYETLLTFLQQEMGDKSVKTRAVRTMRCGRFCANGDLIRLLLLCVCVLFVSLQASRRSCLLRR